MQTQNPNDRASLERQLVSRKGGPRDFGGSAPGANLTDANVSILFSEGVLRRLPLATLTGNHTCTLGTTGAVKGDQITIVRDDVEAFTYTIIDGGGPGNLLVMPASKKGFAKCQFDGTNWFIRECSPQ